VDSNIIHPIKVCEFNSRSFMNVESPRSDYGVDPKRSLNFMSGGFGFDEYVQVHMHNFSASIW